MNESAWMKWIFDSARGWVDVDYMTEETGIDVIDQEHKTIAEFIVALNLLSDRLSKEVTIDLVNEQRSVLEMFLHYIQHHFSREEKLIAILNKDNLEEHRLQHSVIFQKIKEDVRYYISGEFTVAFDTARLIFESLYVHINREDKKAFQKKNLSVYIAGAKSWQQLFTVVRSMGIDSIDIEHRQICSRLLSLFNSMKSNYEQFLLSLEDFYRVFENHCRDEEAVIEKYSMQQIENQKATHASMLSSLKDNITFYKNSKPESIDDSRIHSFFIDFVHHINTLDYESFRKGNWRTFALETMSGEDICFLLRKTGISMIDEQHQEYIRKVMELFLYMNEGEKTEQIHQSFKDIIEYAHFHFNEEEKIFPSGISLSSPRHHDEHRKLLENLETFFNRLSSSAVFSILVFRETILKWWLSHTNFTDIDTFGSLSFNQEAEDD